MLTSNILVASCSETFEPVRLVKEILSIEDLPASINPLEGIRAYPWHLDTKYYTVDVALCTTDVRTIGNKDFAESVEAVLVYFDSNDKSSFSQVKSWIPFVKEINPEVKLLICEKSLPTHVIPREFVQEWCLDYNFELVELDPEVDEDDDDVEDDFPDSFGTKRIIQALHAHTWPHMVMKDEPNIRSPYFNGLMKEQAAEQAKEIQDKLGLSSSVTRPDDAATSAAASGDINPSSTTDSSSHRHVGDSEEGGSSERSTSGTNSTEQNSKPKKKNRNDMIEKSEMMPPEQRKAYAEQMAISFWRAVGGDEDEIANLSDSSDD
ncbi:hypothetical protein LSH36_107g11044 [Paralvinella palmiformis]|uniref:Alpha-and gamma-adaptin-binding protein p34 n=1 Tax=Paralvinella palmiformis TaxID=53620 RepID=A0AAD9K0R5_9ANNE|nr:hypothetical protein LSH36_107g11044 [Paralvinella palmiformis]